MPLRKITFLKNVKQEGFLKNVMIFLMRKYKMYVLRYIKVDIHPHIFVFIIRTKL